MTQTNPRLTHLLDAGPMVEPFPYPGPALQAAMDRLQFESTSPPENESDVRALTELPRPWDPGTCPAPLRHELWPWLDKVAAWINEQHLWNMAHNGIPECWPDHPHLVHDLAAVACSRYYTRFSPSPAELNAWHTYCLPEFLNRLHHRLGDGCQPRRHLPCPRAERDRQYWDEKSWAAREDRFASDGRHASPATE